MPAKLMETCQCYTGFKGKGRPDLVNNHRQKSLTRTVFKVMEKVIFKY